MDVESSWRAMKNEGSPASGPSAVTNTAELLTATCPLELLPSHVVAAKVGALRRKRPCDFIS